MIKIKRGLDLPISGAPEQTLYDAQPVNSVAVLGGDFVGMKPTMLVAQGERVKLGQPLFSDKSNSAVCFTAPGAGVVSKINRGAQRKLLSVVIELDGDDSLSFQQVDQAGLTGLSRQDVVKNLLDSGLWTALRTRPFSKVPNPEQQAHSLYINAMDSNPLAVDPALVIKPQLDDFVAGVNILAKLPQHQLYLCTPLEDSAAIQTQSYDDNVEIKQFGGVHPAGLTGTHMHFIKPASSTRQMWSINYQDVIAVGKLFRTGQLPVERVISLAGPQLKQSKIIKTRIGANLNELTHGLIEAGESRIISGSVLSGNTASGDEAFLGRYHLQVSVLREGRERPLFGYLSPGANRHSVMGIYLTSIFKKKIPMATSTQGSDRAMVPIGAYEKIMPLDILPTQLLRALIVGDIETAQQLGVLELDEEDLALCSYVCSGKYEYGPILRDTLTRIEKEA